jgi:hypothetical protein
MRRRFAWRRARQRSQPEIYRLRREDRNVLNDIRTSGSSDLMSPEKDVQRIMWTGTIWFGVAVGSVAVTMGLLLSSGWRPAQLGGGLEILWWAAAALVTVSIGLIGWSGCPILEVSVPTADRNKTKTMQLGTAAFILGSAVSLIAVLLGPAH